MRIGILAVSSREGGGTFQYTCSLIEALSAHSVYREFVYVLKDKHIGLDSSWNPENSIELDVKSSSFILRILRMAYVKAPFTRHFLDVSGSYKGFKDSVDLILNPTINLIPMYLGKPYVVTIHDLQHKYHPEFFTRKECLTRDFVYANAARNALFVVCESRFVKDDIVKFLEVAPERIEVISSLPPSFLTSLKMRQDISERISEKYHLPTKFLFYPAQFWRHKNHVDLIRAIDLVKRRYEENIPLVLVGSQKENFKSAMCEVKKLRMENQIRYLGYVPDGDIPYLYRLSTALVMPTLFESLSIPIWEAFYLGCPVVASNVCALPEQIGNAGLLFNPHDVGDMADKIYRMWADENIREELVNRGYERVRDLTLENYAKQWEKVINKAVEKRLSRLR